MHVLNPSTMVRWIFYVSILASMISCYGGAVTVRLPPGITVPGVIGFGDSIIDPGNNNRLTTLVKCDFPPYGQDFPSTVPTGRFSNGMTPPDIIAKALGITDQIPAYLDPNLNSYNLTKGVSFASGGSGYDPQTPLLVSAISLPAQLKQFQEYIKKLKDVTTEESANDILKNSLYMVVVGSDDLANTYYTVGIRRLEYDIPSYADLLVSHASTFIQELYQLGARRIGVLGIPPIGCLPVQRTFAGGPIRACVEDRNQAARLVNAKISSAMDSLTESLPQSRVVYIDIYTSLLQLIQNPLDFGFEVSDRGCCGTGDLEVAILCNRFSATCEDHSKYVFWDSYHPTEKAYKILVDHIIETYMDKFL